MEKFLAARHDAGCRSLALEELRLRVIRTLA
jgi:hypothetical protein